LSPSVNYFDIAVSFWITLKNILSLLVFSCLSQKVYEKKSHLYKRYYIFILFSVILNIDEQHNFQTNFLYCFFLLLLLQKT